MAIQRHVTQERIGFLRKEIGLFLDGRSVNKATDLIREVIDIGNNALADVMKGDRKSLVDFTYASGMLSKLIRHVPLYLHQKDLLEGAYGVVQDPLVLSNAIMTSYNSSHKAELSLSLKAVELGGLLSVEAIGRVLRNNNDYLETDDNFPISVFTRLVENMANGESSLREASFCPGNQFNILVSCTSRFMNSRQYRDIINHVIAKADIYNGLSTKKLYTSKSPTHFLEIALNQRINPKSFAYLNKVSPELFDCVMNSKQLSIAYAVMSSVERNGLDISGFPKHQAISNNSCMNSYLLMIAHMTINSSSYKGLSHHWTPSEGTSINTAALNVPGAGKLFRGIKSHRNAFSKFLDEMLKTGSKMSDIKYNNDFVKFYNSGLEVFDRLYIKPESRILADEIRAKNYLIYGVLAMEGNSVLSRIKEHPEHAASKGMLEAIYCVLTGNKSNTFLAAEVLNLLFNNKETRHVFSHMDKKMHDMLMPHVKADEDALRTVNWKDSAIKRDYINNDMGL
jgi:hypothetical protein